MIPRHEHLGWSGIRIARLSSGEIWTMACRMRYFTELSPPDYCVATVDKLGLTVQTESCEDQTGGILDIPCPSVNGKIYIIGGLESDISPSKYVYDPTLDS